MTGSNNGLGRTPEGDEEYADRNRANLAWLKHQWVQVTIDPANPNVFAFEQRVVTANLTRRP